MNIFKKISSLGIISIMLASSIPTSLLANVDQFSDVNSETQFSTAINYLAEHKVINGYEDGTFKPENTINRAEFTKILIASIKEDSEITGESCFTDVLDNETHWFAKYVCTAKTMGVIKGYENSNFKPAQNITFVEAAKIISKVMGEATEDETTWFKNYVAELSDKMVIPTTIIDLNKDITRAEMSEMIWRLLENITDQDSSQFNSETLSLTVQAASNDSDEEGDSSIYTNDLFSFSYNSNLTPIETEYGVSFTSFQTVEGDVAALCNERDESHDIDHELPDFNFYLDILDMDLQAALIEQGDNFVESDYYNEVDQKLTLEEGFIDIVALGSESESEDIQGYRVTSGAEGCGIQTFYFPISETQTLTIASNTSLVPLYSSMYTGETLPEDTVSAENRDLFLSEIIDTFHFLNQE